MNNKKAYQFLLIFFILVIFSGIYYIYFYSKIDKDQLLKTKEETNLPINSKKNQIENLNFESFDKTGNKYTINALHGNPELGNPEIIILTQVNALIQFPNGEKITINSNSAKYNRSDNETRFSGNIKAKYINHILTSENLDLLFKDHLIIAYNELVYENLNNTLIADRLEINIVTKNLKIFMNNEFENVTILRD